jgi:hypothetical protein
MMDWVLIHSLASRWIQSKKFWAGALAALLAAVVLLWGLMHVVSGSTYKGSVFVPKLSFGFSETFINADAIMGMPYFVAKSQFPLSVLALQRVGFLETEAQMRKRIEGALKVEMDKLQAEADQEMRKSQAEFQAAMEKLVRQ